MDNLNYNLLKVFLCVATSNSFLEASKKLYISQPAISKSIKALEDELKVNLFYRGNKGICLTKEGEILLKYVKEAYNVLEIGERKIVESNSLNDGILVIGINSDTSNYVFDSITRFKNDYPGVKIKVLEASMSLLEEHEVDFIITTSLEESEHSNVKKTRVSYLSSCFIKSKTYDSGNIILPSINNPLRKKLNIDIKHFYEFDSMELIKKAVSNNMGIGLVLDENISDDFIKTDLNYELPDIDINLFYIENYLTRIANIFINDYILKKDI